MTLQKAKEIITQVGVKIAIQHRFAFNTGTMLRLENYAMINIFDDGRYYIQGEDTEALVIAFGQVEEQWDPDSWSGEVPNQPPPIPVRPLSNGPSGPNGPQKRFDF
jgi:hypothetical protein